MEEIQALNGQEYKLQLAFDRGLFQTQWFPLFSSNPQLVLKELDITFIYSDSVIVDVKTLTECAY